MTSAPMPAETFAPGEHLRDESTARGWSEKHLAEMLGRPVRDVSEILNGSKQILPDTARALADAIETSPDLWLNLQTAFNLHAAKLDRPERPPIAVES